MENQTPRNDAPPERLKPVARTIATHGGSFLKQRSILLTLLLTFWAAVKPAAAEFNYTVNADLTVTITGYTGPTPSAIIPATISGLPVTTIADGTFQNRAGITNISIPSSVTNIGPSAFQGCYELVSLNLDANNPLWSSADGVLFTKDQETLLQFPYAKSGPYFIPAGVTSLGSGAFAGCSNLASVVITNGLSDIAPNAFSGSSLVSFVLGDSVTNIEGQAFANCGRLAAVVIPPSVLSIGPNAFDHCTSLSSLTLTNGVTTIGDYAFFWCAGLTSLSIPDTVTSIGAGAFWVCTGLTNVTIPDSVREIGAEAFGSCNSLTAAKLGEGLTTISESLFDNCPSLTSIALPDSVLEIQGFAFEKCASLTNVTLSDHLTTIGQYAFAYCPLRSIVLPNTLTNIDRWAFESCTNLCTIIIPSSVQSIGVAAFADCTRLEGVYFRGDAPAATTGLFEANTIVYYVPGTQGWGSTFANRPALPIQMQLEAAGSGLVTQSNRFVLTISGTYGLNVVVEATIDVAKPSWIPVQTNALAGSPIIFTDPDWTNHTARFYRLRWL